jgi:hypothetical protein
LTQNGSTLTGISLGGSIATLPVMLQAGANNFNLSVNTGCGSTQTSFTINYTANVAPPTNNTNDNNGGVEKPTNSPQNNQPKPANTPNKGGGGTAPNNTPTPAKEVKPAVTPAPVPNNTPTPAKEVKPAVTPAPAPNNTPTPAKETKPVEGGGTEKLPVQNKPAKGGGK